MPKIELYNVVLVGEDLPVDTVEVSDFDFQDRTPQVPVRFPVLFEARADDYVLLVSKERYQLTVVRSSVDDDSLRFLKENGELLTEYAGRRSLRFVGHNVTAHLDPSEADPVELLESFTNRDALSDIAGQKLEPRGEVTVSFKEGDASLVTLKLTVVPEKPGVVVNLNYHFDLEKNPKTRRPQLAIGRIGDSLASATEILRRLGER